MKKIVLFIPLFFISLTIFAQNTIRNFDPVIWQKSENNTVANSRHINYNPIFFSNDNKQPLNIPYERGRKSTQLTFFTVFQNTDTLSEKTVWTVNKDIAGLTTKQSYGYNLKAAYSGGNMVMPVINIVRQTWGKPLNGDREGVVTLAPVIKDTDIFTGTIAEFLVFDKVLDNRQTQMLNSYLGIKYGITVYQDYVSSKNNVIWNTGNFVKPSFHVLAIGHDDGYGLIQKQSTDVHEGGIFTLAAGKIMPDNISNTFNIENTNFIAIGDNGEYLVTEKQPGGFTSKLPLTDRKWMVQLIGTQANKIPTQLAVNMKSILSYAPACFLVVDRSGTGNFEGSQPEYIPVTKLTADSIAYFDNITWDTDGNGKDCFAISAGFFKNNIYKQQYEDSMVHFANTDFTATFKCTTGNFLKSVIISKLPERGILYFKNKRVTVPAQISLQDLNLLNYQPEPDFNGRIVFNWEGTADYGLSGVKGMGLAPVTGEVIINILPANDTPVITDLEKATTQNTNMPFTNEDFASVFTDVDGDTPRNIKILDLPRSGVLMLNGIAIQPDQTVQANQIKHLIYIPTNNNFIYDSFTWNASDGMAYANFPAQVNISYLSKEKLTDGSNGISAMVYPNPAHDKFRLAVMLDKEAGITVEIINQNGAVVQQTNDSNKKSNIYNYTYSITEPGNYFVRIGANNKYHTCKLIIVK